MADCIPNLVSSQEAKGLSCAICVPPCFFPTYLLPQPHDLEALKVVQLLPPRRLLHLLRVGASGPLGINISRLPLLLQGRGSSSSWELGNDDIGERQALESSGMTWNGELLDRRWAIYEDLQKCEPRIALIQFAAIPSPAISSPGVPRTRLWSMI